MLRRKQRHVPPIGTPCANCRTELQGPFCHACGQGADNNKRSILKLLWEAVKDFFSWDGRFIRTVPTLFFRPGRLARDYLEGRIARHVPAFRLFLIALVVFILSAQHFADRIRDMIVDERQQQIVLLSTPEGRNKEAQRIRTAAVQEKTGEYRDAQADRAAALAKGADPAKTEADYTAETRRADAEYLADMKQADEIVAAKGGGPVSIGADFKIGGQTQQSAQVLVGRNEAWLQRGFQAAAANPDYYFVILFNWGQRLAVLLLPVLALTLGLAYVTKRKYFLFDHLIVAMNVLSFAFLTNAFGFWLPWSVLPWWGWLLVIWTPINLFQTLRGAYGSSVLGAILKSLFIWTVNGLAFVGLAVAVVVYAFRQMA